MLPYNYMPFDWMRLGLCLVVIAGLVLALVKTLKDPESQRYGLFLLLGLVIYGALGSALEMTHPRIFIYIQIYLCAFVLSFIVVQRFLDTNATSFYFDANNFIIPRHWWKFIAFGLVAFFALRLVYPEFRLHRLLLPPLPDIGTAVDRKFDRGGSSIELVLYSYLVVMAFPFFLISLGVFKKYWWIGIGLFLFWHYMSYVRTAYIARNEMALIVITIFFVLWIRHDFSRKFLKLCAVVGVPSVLFFFYFYMQLRTEDSLLMSLNPLNVIRSILTLVYMEISFPSQLNILLNRAGGYITDYLTWIVTLPIPSFVYDYSGVRFNQAFTETLTGKFFAESDGNTTRTILLPSLPGEGLFLFGKTFFWLHAAILGAISSVACFFTKRDPKLIYLHIFFLVDGMLMARSGSGGAIPIIFNQCVLFWPLAFMLAMRIAKNRTPRSMSGFFVPRPGRRPQVGPPHPGMIHR